MFSAPERTRLGYRPSLDGVRAVACLAVVLAHTMPGPFVQAGAVGVAVFFVLSGFLITSLLLEERDRTGSISLGRFYERRARRLLPAVIALVTVIMFLPGLLGRGNPVGLLSIVGYFSNFAEIHGIATGPLSHCWSLAVEEHFYLLWPLALLVTRFKVVATSAVAFVASTGWCIWLLAEGADARRIYIGTDTRIASIAVGCVGAVLVLRGVRLCGWVIPASLIILAGESLLSLRGFLWALPAGEVLALGLVIAAATSGSRLLSWRPLVGVGKVSYGLYLWSVPIADRVGKLGALTARQTVVTLCLSALATVVSYRLIELPVRAGASRSSGRVDRLAVESRLPAVGIGTEIRSA
jgi:peptidoglycan/LPS O-acetylase OafA/YrhL